MAAISVSSVETITRVTLFDCKPAAIEYAINGKPAKLRMFLRGIPFEPPRAGIKAKISISLWALPDLDVFSTSSPSFSFCLPCGPAAIHNEVAPGHVRRRIGREEQEGSVHLILARHT